MTWRPLDKDARDGPQPLSRSLDRIAHALGAPTARALVKVFAGWNDAVGEQAAPHTRPVSLLHGVLVVEVDHPTWATHLRYGGKQVIERLDAIAGEGIVTRIDPRVAGHPGGSSRR